MPPIAALLERALANLIANALALRAGRRPVRVDGRRRRASTARPVDVRVIDRGPGIRPADRELVFQPFQRVVDHRADGAGVGLGLAIARGFVEAMGGELAIEDTPGGGTTMVVSLPVARPARSPAMTRVLVVDDEAPIRRALRPT